jgi:uncharacterized protein YndB with AHSA1/START domain
VNPTLTIRRRFAAPPVRVYAAWTDPTLFARWIGPVGVPCQLLQMDPVPGGRFLLDMHLADGRVIHVGGQFTRLEPPGRIELTWGAADGSIVTQVAIVLRAASGGTEMEFQHRLPAEDMVPSHRDGWTSAFGKLQSLVEA